MGGGALGANLIKEMLSGSNLLTSEARSKQYMTTAWSDGSHKQMARSQGLPEAWKGLLPLWLDLGPRDTVLNWLRHVCFF